MCNFLPWCLAIVCIVFALLWNPKVSGDVNSLLSHKISRVLLLTAHPDDECMFFAPTILSLTAKTDVYSLCLSTGDADGLGEIRKAELERSLDILGVRTEHRWILDHPNLRDNITETWDTETIATAVRPHVVENRITTILTFDYGGISGHPNHRSLPTGAKRLASQLLAANSAVTPRLFTLVTVPVVTKYTGPLAALLAEFNLHLADILQRVLVQVLYLLTPLGLQLPSPTSGVNRGVDIMPVFVSGIGDYFKAVRAMEAHRSQLVWFRWLYVLFSRYMWVNEWIEV